MVSGIGLGESGIDKVMMLLKRHRDLNLIRETRWNMSKGAIGYC